MAVSPFLVSEFTHPASIYSLIKVLLRWFCVSRNQQRGILRPEEPGFALYRNLPLILSLFDVRKEMRKYYTAGLLSKRMPCDLPHFLRGLQSFLQLKSPHFCSTKLFEMIRTFFIFDSGAQERFPHAWQLISTAVVDEYGSVSLNECVEIHCTQYPAYFFLYAMLTSAEVPSPLKRALWMDIRTAEDIVLPAKLKGIEHYHRLSDAYKSYHQLCKPTWSTGRRKLPSSCQQLLNLCMVLEYRALHHPTTRASMKVSNVPLIKLDSPMRPTHYPIICKERCSKVFDNTYVYTDRVWVLRGRRKSTPSRAFLVDEIAVLNKFDYVTPLHGI